MCEKCRQEAEETGALSDVQAIEASINREIDTLVDLLGARGAALMLRNMTTVLIGERWGTGTKVVKAKDLTSGEPGGGPGVN